MDYTYGFHRGSAARPHLSCTAASSGELDGGHLSAALCKVPSHVSGGAPVSPEENQRILWRNKRGTYREHRDPVRETPHLYARHHFLTTHHTTCGIEMPWCPNVDSLVFYLYLYFHHRYHVEFKINKSTNGSALSE